MIPGFVVAWLTFPGVIVHELAHAMFCRLFRLDIYKICIFQFSANVGQPAGYVVHQRSDKPWQDLVISVGPFLINSIVGVVIAMPAAIPILYIHSMNPLDLFLCWLGISITMHAFPSIGDARSVWRSVVKDSRSVFWKLVAVPVIGLIYLGALGSMFWLDAIYGVAIIFFLPKLIIMMLA